MNNRINIAENTLKYFLEGVLHLKFDICTCQICKQEMMNYLLSKFPSRYVDTDDGNYDKIEKEFTQKYLRNIFSEITNAINKVSHNIPHRTEGDKEKEFNNLLEEIRKDRGIDFSQYHKNILKRRIALRLITNKVNSYREYMKILNDKPAEYEKLFEVLTINVSDFFRDLPVWLLIEKILKQIIEESNAKKEPIKLWCAGCANGQEPYSLAILSKVINNIKVPLKIYATDIDSESISSAKKGAYDIETIEKTKSAAKQFSFKIEDFFSLKENMYYLKDEIKNLVEIKYLDLTSGEYVPNVNMLLCRNVFIYFNKSLQEQILDKFYRSLRDGGYLVQGNTETLPIEAGIVFHPVDRYYRIYQKHKI